MTDLATPHVQYAIRSLKQLEIVSGPPDYAQQAFSKPEGATKTFQYSADGRFFASVNPAGVQIIDAQSSALVSEILLKGVIEISFSPLGNQISTWERHVKPEEGQPGPQNLKVWDVATAAELAGFSQKAQDGWALQYTEDESKVVRIVTNEVHVLDPKNFGNGIAEKLRLEGVTSFSISPGTTNACVALFVAEKKGAPASVKIHSLSNLSTMICAKNFFKADKIQMKWNKSGNNLLFLTQTEVDKTGKSYYGESNLYMMTSNGSFDCRVTLDKDGGIHDFAWSPNDREFAVTYGFMPAKTVIFDQKVKIINDFGPQPRNFLAYNPQGRLLCIAGFGNLAGQVDIWDRKTLKKVCTIDAPNTSQCQWSPDGRYLLCATLSPRLRVDNGMRIFHYTGALMHVDSVEELYQVSWRPADVALFPFAGPVEAAPTASISVQTSAPAKPAAAGGAYRPPHARGTLTPTSFKREDEGGLAYNPSNGTNNFPGHGGDNGRGPPGFPSKGRVRNIPGSAPPPGLGEPAGEGDGTSRRKKKETNKNRRGEDASEGSGATTPAAQVPVVVAQEPVVEKKSEATLQAEAQLSADDKKRRALMKKLTAIDALKIKKAFGEKLELTQLKKLESEKEIRQQLSALDIGGK